ncbi:hypothetical protein POPTR_003G082300v4 [Populus trichocarpa]|nr:hypothetical protein POPTR_003G082300v4 [Populus trichocarpa]
MAFSRAMLMLTLMLALIATSIAQDSISLPPIMALTSVSTPPSSSAAPPSNTPTPPPAMTPPPVSSPPPMMSPPPSGTPPMSPGSPSSPPSPKAPEAPAPAVSQPGNGAFVHGNRMALSALLGGVAFLFV